ncbi:MAG: TonB-dependent receptor [Planctomycetota bacterium]
MSEDDPVLDTVTVTARRWEEELDTVPQSLTVLEGDTLERGGVTSLREVAERVPNLHIVEFNARRLSFPFVRGVGSGQGDPAIVTYVDGVPQLTGSSMNVPLLDLDRIEVLRGSQGTLYGRNALGGVIHVISREPPTEPVAWARATLGDYRLQDYSASVGGSVPGLPFGASLAARFHTREGYTENDVTGNDIDDVRSFAGRGQVVWYPTDSASVRAIVFGERARDGGFALSSLDALRERPHRVQYDFEGDTQRDSWGTTVAVNADVTPFALSSTTGVQFLDAQESADFDFSPLDLVRRTVPEELVQITQEVRAGTAEDSDLSLSKGLDLRWLAGALFFYGTSERGFENELRPDGVTFGQFLAAGVDRSDTRGRDWGVGAYGQGTLTLWDDLDVTLGLRFDFEEKKARVENAFDVAGAPPGPASVQRVERDDREFSPSLEVAYRWTEDVMTYARVAGGFKAGGFNARTPDGDLKFDPERSWTVEAGTKTSWFDQRLQVNASLFWLSWDDMQLTLFDPVIGGFVRNAGEATSFGLEVEGAAKPAEWIELFSGFGWTIARFDEFEDPLVGDAKNKDLPLAPRFTFSGGLELKAPIFIVEGVDAFVRFEEVVVGRYAYDAINDEEQGSYPLTHVRAGVRGERWSVEAWVQNVFDAEYFPIAFRAGPGFVGNSGAPRTFGFTASLRF